jgi:hypothetical protein
MKKIEIKLLKIFLVILMMGANMRQVGARRDLPFYNLLVQLMKI